MQSQAQEVTMLSKLIAAAKDSWACFFIRNQIFYLNLRISLKVLNLSPKSLLMYPQFKRFLNLLSSLCTLPQYVCVFLRMVLDSRDTYICHSQFYSRSFSSKRSLRYLCIMKQLAYLILYFQF